LDSRWCRWNFSVT